MKSSHEKLKKTALFSLIGASAGSLLFIPWSMSRSHNMEYAEESTGDTLDSSAEDVIDIPDIAVNKLDSILDSSIESITHKLSDFEQAFATARAKFGKGCFFEFNDRPYSTFYKEEWDSMDLEQKHNFLNQIRQIESDLGFAHSVPVAGNITEDMHPEDAFIIARAEVGPGGVFTLHNTLYATYTQEEINNLSPEEYNSFFSAISDMDLSVPVHDMSDIHAMDFHFDDILLDNARWDLDYFHEIPQYHEEGNFDVSEKEHFIANLEDTYHDIYPDYFSEDNSEHDLEIGFDNHVDVME
jgi:hypothetical protein